MYAFGKCSFTVLIALALLLGTAVFPVGALASGATPTISIGAPSKMVARSGMVMYTVMYGGATNVTLSPSDVTVTKTGTADATVLVTGTGTTYRTIHVSSIKGDGTLGISIAAGTATDAAGNLAPAAGPSATFTVDNTAPSINSITFAPAKAAAGDPVLVVVNATDAVGVGQVMAGTTSLQNQGSSQWVMTLTAPATLGNHPISFIATDAVGNAATSSGSYNTVRSFGLNIRSTHDHMSGLDPILTAASANFIFTFWGQVSQSDSNGFLLDNGCGTMIKVLAADHGLTDGNCASARGELDVTANPPALNAHVVTKQY